MAGYMGMIFEADRGRIFVQDDLTDKVAHAALIRSQ